MKNQFFINGETYTKNKDKFYKIDNAEYIEVSDSELEIIEEYLNDINYDTFATKKLNEIASINPELKNIDILKGVLDRIDINLDDKYKDNFYNNLKTVRFTSTDAAKNNNNIGEYDYHKNIIHIYKNNLADIKNKLRSYNNPDKCYDFFANYFLTHEIMHLASTDLENITDNNTCFKEGLTDYFAANICSNIDPTLVTNSFEIEKMIVKQIELLIGKDVLKDYYFNSKNISKLKGELVDFVYNVDSINSLFDLIEFGCNKNMGEVLRYSSLLGVQRILLDFEHMKFRMLALDSFNYDEISKFIKTVKENYISSDVLIANGINPQNDKYRENDDKLDVLTEEADVYLENNFYKRKIR